MSKTLSLLCVTYSPLSKAYDVESLCQENFFRECGGVRGCLPRVY